MNCNFQCWYCYESHIRGSRLNSDTKGRINAFITAVAQRKEIKTFYLSFFGGEPLLHFKTDNIPILEHFRKTITASDIDFAINYTTNAYLINDDFIDYFKSRNIRCSLQITLDGYRDEHDKVRNINNKKGSYDKIIDNIKLLVRNAFPIRLRINYTAKNIADTFKIADDLADIAEPRRKKYLVFDFHRVWQDDDGSEEVRNILIRNINIIKKKGFDAITMKYTPNNVRASCYADKRNSVVINYNADIFKCTARDFIRTNREGYLNGFGELVWENGNLERRMNAKFKNKSCLSCRILPLCNGGCSQHALENEGKDYCVYGWDNSEKDTIVTTKIDELINAYQSSEV